VSVANGREEEFIFSKAPQHGIFATPSLVFYFPIDGNRHIRTYLRTKRAGNASLQIFLGNNRREKPLAVDFIAHFDQAVGAGRGAERAPFAA